MEALKPLLMGLFEKRRAFKFIIYVQDYSETDPKTREGMDLTRVTTRDLIAKYGLDDNTVDFIGHALALHRDDCYLNEPALDIVKRMKLEFNEEGKVIGVTSEGETAKCKKVVCDPSYLPNKVRNVGKVARAIAIMSHPIPNTNESHSMQVLDFSVDLSAAEEGIAKLHVVLELIIVLCSKCTELLKLPYPWRW
ncbi:hypothetical protein ACFX2I_007165 [Malus domestica]